MTAAPPEPPLSRDLRNVAPLLAANVGEALNRCWLAGLDPVVHEALRTQERQSWLYGIGRDYTPLGYDVGSTVTNVRDALTGWHIYGLAVDIRSRSTGWDDPSFFARCAVYFEAAGCDWGGRWQGFKDLSHFQFGTLKPSPSHLSRDAYTVAGGGEAGRRAVWALVGAVAAVGAA